MRRQARRAEVVATTLFVAAVLAPWAAAQQLRLVVDETGRRVGVPARVERIVSLAPSITEILFALGLESRLAGVTDWCDFPPAAKSKPSVGQVISPSLEKIAALKPDLVLATTAGNRRETATAIEQLGIPLYGLNPRSVEEVLTSIRTLGELLHVPQAGADLEAGLRSRLKTVAARVGGRPRLRVLFVLWLEPLMSIGRQTFVHDALVRAGAESVSAERPEDWPRLSLEEALRQNPDYLILAHSPALERRLAALRTDPVWSTLHALRENRIVLLDEAVLRPGPRIVDAIEQLARALHPEAFEPR
jgi:iron complex transport system substrate-binding protein